MLDAVLRVDRRDAAIGEQLHECRVDVFHQQVIRTAQPHGDRPAQFGLAVLGVLIGLGGSFAAVRLLRHMLFGVSIYDPWAFVAGTALLGVVALVGCLIPARRATQVDPMVALRSE